MTDQESPFASFVPSGEAPVATATEKTAKPKRGRKPSGTSKPKEPKVAAAPKPAKPKRTRKAKAPRAMKVELGAAMAALSGLQEEDAAFVMSVAAAMGKFSKKQRQRIAVALGKIFA